MRRPLHNALLGGASLLVLMMSSEVSHARSLTPGANTVVPTAAAQQAAIEAAQQAAGAAAQAQISMARAKAALDVARKAQQDAAALAAGGQKVPNGLGVGGLMPYGGNAADPLAGIKADPSKWVGAAAPSQTQQGSQVTVDINQTAPKAILNWRTFNVGSDTTVNFKQGASDWIALNRVTDPDAAPSQILGKVNAPGAVYIINRNGIIFGAGSQINVHTLVASSLDIGKLGTSIEDRDQYFLNTGIANLNSFSIYDADKSAADKATLVAGDVKVERGASITANIATDLVPLGSAGQIYLFGTNVHNSGLLKAETGEIALVAARTIDVVPNGYSLLPASVLGTDASGKLLKFRGSEFRISQFDDRYQTSGNVGYPATNHYKAGTGAVTHDGVIDASRGIVVMNGDTVSINNPTDANGHALTDAAGQLVRGVISVDTSIDRNSMVLLRAATSVTMNGVISSLPFDDGAAPLPTGGSSGSSVQAFTPAYIEMTAQTSVTIGSTGLVYAPSAQVVLRAVDLSERNGAILYQQTGAETSGALYAQRLFNQGASDAHGSNGNPDVLSNSSAPQSVLLAPGATIDVSGLQNVELPASYNIIRYDPRAEFADMPLQRSGPLYGQFMYIDIRATGTRSDGTTWVGTPLFDASGAIGKVGRSIDQLMTAGGSLSMKTDFKGDGSGSVQTAGSVVNLAGGSVKFLPGKVNTTTLIGSDGRRYSMTNANPNMTYLGIAGSFTVDHSHWGVTETWSTDNRIDMPGYTEGQAAGALNISTTTPSLPSTLYFGSVAGERQISSGQLPWQGSIALVTPSSVQIGDTGSANYTTPNSHKIILSGDTLSGYGLSEFKVTANDFVLSEDSKLSLAPGGSLSVFAGAIDIAGSVTASGGAVSLTTDSLTLRGSFGDGNGLIAGPVDSTGKPLAANVYVEGTIDVSGRFVNDTGRMGAEISGPAYINGGSISITTNKDRIIGNGPGSGADSTGSILLASSSVLDVSSGGYISPLGKVKMSGDKTKPNAMAGKAGSISLAIYQGRQWLVGEGEPLRPNPAISQVAVLQLDGRLLGYGFESNGSLRLATADTVRIGGTLQPGETSGIRIGGVASTLPTALLAGGGFGSYTIETVRDDYTGASARIIVSSGTSLTLQQRNLSSTVDYSSGATGTKLAQQSAPQLALLADDQRTPVNLTLKADNILLDTGSTIVTDPKANITLAAVNDLRTLSLSDPTRTVPAQNVDLRGTIVNHGGTVFINALKTHLGPQAVVDLSGTFVANSRFGQVGGQLTSGSYIAGGKFSVEAGAANTITNGTYSRPGYDAPSQTVANYVVADAGALVDVSGAAGNIEVMTGSRTTSSQWSWSDAGTVSVDSRGLAWAGGFAASGGRYVGSDGQVHADARANGGTIIVGGGLVMSLRQDMTDVKAAAAAGTPQQLFVSADQLAPFENVYLYAAAGQDGAARIFTDLPENTYAVSAPAWGTLNISGPLDLNVANRLHIAAGTIAAPSAGTVDARMSAAYVSLTGIPGTTASGNSTLTITGKTIDVEGAGFSGFRQVSLLSSGDLRLSTPKIANGVIQGTNPNPVENSTFTGKIDTKGDLLLSAQRIYPVTAVDFTIQTPGNVKFAAPAGSNTKIPLSAGGSLTVIAKTIEQGGNLFAPLGKITLGNLDSAVSSIITQSVVLKAGSLTSVTLADTTVPYGATLDGTTWYYNASLNPLLQPPSKGIVLAGSDVERSDGSTIDLRGGGDLQAQEWIPGKGGSVDTLASTPGQTVYALVPSQGDPVSSVDLHFATARSPDLGKTMFAGDSIPLPGTQITIDGGNGIPAGTYTLYPAHYATLPGAIRVVYYGDNTGANLPSGTKLPDGTVLVTGHTTQSTMPGKQSSGQSVFAVRTNSVWQQYSEYGLSGANSFYTQSAVKQNIVVPRLPMDAGRLAMVAQNSIILNGIALTEPGRDSNGNIGRGSELDISAPKLAVIDHASYVKNDIPTGYVGLDLTQLNGFESILIGGQRSDTTKGTLITAGADSVLVDTKGEVLSAPEILLVAKVAKPGSLQNIPQALTTQDGQTVGVDDQIFAPGANSGTVQIASGSVITTKGVVHVGSGRNYYFADPAPEFAGADGKATSAQDIATLLGGTLDPTGKIITGADISKLGYFIKNADGTISHHAGTLSAAELGMLQNYSYQTTGLGAMFVASNDSTLKVSGPSGIAPTSLTIQFAASNDPKLGALSGGIVLPADVGRVAIDSGASITTNTLTLQATASKNSIVGNSSNLHLQQLNVVARTIGLGSPSLIFDESAALYNQQFADVKALSLKALSGVVTVYGDFNPGSAVTSLTLDAAAVVRAGNAGSAQLSLGSGTVTLTNTGTVTAAPATAPSADPAAALTVFASDIQFGGGTQSILGYGQVKLLAGHGVFVAGVGKTTLGAGDDVVDLSIATPSILVGGATSKGGGSFALTTKGNIAVVDGVPGGGAPVRPADSSETGGSLSFTAANIIIDSTIQAQAGTIALQAKGSTQGAANDFGVALRSHAYLAAGGYKKTLVDVDTYLSGGKVLLTSDKNNVLTDAGSVIDVSQPAGGAGYGGSIVVTALAGTASLAGDLRGSGGPGLGGGFKLDIKGAADLDALADKLAAGGINGAIDIHTRTGNLVLSQGHTLKANAVALTADDTAWDVNDRTKQFGQVFINGLIDARGYSGNSLNGSGQAGGQVVIYGANAVTLGSTGVIDASTTHADERGGDVTVGIGWEAKSKLFLQTGTQINVSGGTNGGLSGGTVTFRAPLDGNNDVKIVGLSNVANADGSFNEVPVIDGNNVRITGARSLTVNGFITFDTKSGGHGIDGSGLGWGGTIDPNGWYNPDGSVATNGTWTNVSGWQVGSSDITNFVGFTSVPPPVNVPGGNGDAQIQAVMGLSVFARVSPAVPAGQTVVFDVPRDANGNPIPGGVAAEGVTRLQGNIVFVQFTKAGSGYTTAPTTATIDGVPVTALTTSMSVVGVKVTNAGSGYTTTPSNVTISGGGGSATVRFSAGSGFSGKTQNGVFIVDPGQSFIPNASSIVFNPATQGTAGVGNFTGDTLTRAFVTDTLAQVTQGKFSYNGQNYGFSNLYSRMQPLVDQLGASVVHVQPGVDLVNSSGNITVAGNWNLGSGTAGGLKTDPATGKAYFDPSSSYVNFNYRLATPWGGLEAGALTLRASGNININASISDGFFQFGDYLDPSYQAAVKSYIASLTNNGRIIDSIGGNYTYYLNSTGTVPIAPYKASGNAVNATSQDLAAADLFPHELRVCTIDCSAGNIKTITAPASWSYALTAGADVSSANPNARVPLADALAGGKGDVIVDKHTSYSQSLITDKTTIASVTVNLPTMVRTGTGNISVSAARDVIMNDTTAPGVIYAAGVNTAKLNDPGYSLQPVNGVSSVVVTSTALQDLFLEPRILAYGNNGTQIAGGAGLYSGPPTAAAFPEAGGDVNIDAQRDIVGNVSVGTKSPQYYQPWLLSNVGFASSSSSTFGAGIFAPVGTQIASQTAWWIQYGSFQQGFLSAGGNITVTAGHDLKDVSVSAPTTGRVSDGLSAGSTPVTHLYGSGNMIVRAGNDILGGSFYEGSGHASIIAGASIGQNGTISRYPGSPVTLRDVPLLAVDTGQIEMLARGAITIAGVVNPAGLHAQTPSAANPYETSGSALGIPLYISTYGPDSKARLVAGAGDLTITVAPTAVTDSSAAAPVNAASSLYPASFEALALNGSLITTGISEIAGNPNPPQPIISKANIPMPGIVLSPSDHGTFLLLAQDNVDLTFGYPKNPTVLYGSTPRPYFTAGPSLIDDAFDPFQPNSGRKGASTRTILAHADDTDDAIARIYAVNGDITAVGKSGNRFVGDAHPSLQRIEINRPTRVFAGRDIVDLNIIVQNIHTSDVSSIQAGRNITYTGYNNAGGLQVAGPGFFVVQAGGDIGPFVPAAHNNATEAGMQEGIASVGNSSATAVGNIVNPASGGGGSVGLYNTALLGPKDNPRRNTALTDAAGTRQGADIITLFGTKFGVDYQAVIKAYIDPANADGVAHNYLPELSAFLVKIGKPASDDQPATLFAAFNALPKELQQIFVDQVFFAELKAVGVSQKAGSTDSQRGYKVIETMFPASLGYTANALGSGANGAGQLVKTGDLNVLHASIQTRLGGDVSIFGPGGSMIVGSLGTESNTALKLSDIGILTLGGGALNMFVDANVLVNSSRVLTTQGGDVLIWSSNGNIDAGRGSKTILSAPALQVLYDQNDYQSVDLSGFVTGSGIGTVQGSALAAASDLTLLAPRGTIDFGTAGVRATGNAVFFAPVIANASNFQVQGSTSGIPVVSVPNIGALTAGSNATAANTKPTDSPTGNGPRAQASIFIVEVVGYGGGDGQDAPSDDEEKKKNSEKPAASQ